jgi:predicted transcriptional regulator
MKVNKKNNLGPLEHKVMEIVWKQKKATVYSVVEALEQEKCLAYTTVMTVMSRLAKKGILSREKKGKTFIYSPKESKEKFIHQLVKSTINRMIDSFGEEAIVAFVDESNSLSEDHKKDLLNKISDDS